MKKIVAVIGGGAAGLMASYQAAARGAKVVLFERNHNLGRKILISGKGRCNLTNIKDIDDFIVNYPDNGMFLYSSLVRFSNISLMDFFNSRGLKTKVERGGRVFPQSDKALDVVKLLEKVCLDARVEIRPNVRVKQLILEKGRIKGIELYGFREIFNCEKVIIATGGLSYPATGSTGDGYKLARQTGHDIIDPKPSLVPLITKERWVKDLQGLTLKNVQLSMYISDKRISKEFGEMLFTHYGISGPIVLTLSREVIKHINHKKVEASIDLKPTLSFQALENRVLRDFDEYKNKMLKNALDDLLPKTLIPVFIQYCCIDPNKPINQVSRGERKKLTSSLKDFRMTIVGCKEKEAIVTQGGVSLKEVNPKTMESKVVKGLYFAGEVLNIDGVTGGYNLQAAFSTGFLAGISAAEMND